ncbi:MAG TPA: thiamine phosphate synthase, partial [Deltaproteobacteria bacterium]|nr:thiamine phosphate synthase [Deltaproteobacteria bacterium]
MSEAGHPFRLVVNKAAPRPVIKGIYLITDQGDNLRERVATALRGGVSVLQYRAKDKDFDACLSEGAELKKLCLNYGVPFIVNDDLKLARAL